MQPRMFAFKVILGLLTLFASFVVPQASDGLSQCWQNCISHRESNCDHAEPSCICHFAGGEYLPEVVTCLTQNCNNPLTDPDPRVYINDLKIACSGTEFPIPSAIISSAELVVETASARELLGYFTSTAVGTKTDSTGQVLTIDVPIIYPSTGSSVSHASKSTSTPSGRSASISPSGRSTSVSPSASPTASDTAVVSNIATATSSPTTTPSPTSTNKSSGGDGTILNLQGLASRTEAGSLLGLTIGLLAGIIWF